MGSTAGFLLRDLNDVFLVLQEAERWPVSMPLGLPDYGSSSPVPVCTFLPSLASLANSPLFLRSELSSWWWTLQVRTQATGSTLPTRPQHSAVRARGRDHLRSEYSVLGLNSNSSFLLGPGYTRHSCSPPLKRVLGGGQCHVIAWKEAP